MFYIFVKNKEWYEGCIDVVVMVVFRVVRGGV